jgi:hypothetical protein
MYYQLFTGAAIFETAALIGSVLNTVPRHLRQHPLINPA